MNKIILPLLFFILISSNLKSQNKRNISLNYGFIKSGLIRTTSLDGGGGYANKNSYELGFRFYKPISTRVSIETGFEYFSTKVEISSEFPSTETREEILNLITIPLIANYSISRKYYLNSGLLLNIQNTEASFDKQSGIGFSFGLGRKLYKDKFFLVLNPKIDINSILPFANENYHQRLIELGMHIGFGYEF